MNSTTLVAAALGLAQLAGCAVFSGLTGGSTGSTYEEDKQNNVRIRSKMVYERRDAGDWAWLEAFCQDKTTKFRGEQSTACKSVERHQEKANESVFHAAMKDKDLPKLHDVCVGKVKMHTKFRDPACAERDALVKQRFEAESGCDVVIASFEKYAQWTKYHGRSYKELYMNAGRKIAKCGGNWEYVWTKLAHHTSSHYSNGHALLMALRKDGLDVFAELLTHLKKHPTPFGYEHGKHVAFNAKRFLLGTGGGRCAKLMPFGAKMQDEEVLIEWVNYAGKAKCAKGAKYASSMLTSDKPAYRSLACWTLGEIGTNAHAKKLKVLAKTDPTYKMVRLSRVYWVRDQCREAAGRIALR